MQDKESFIHNLFSRIAKNYDFINDLMTFSLHRSWKKQAVDHASSGEFFADGAKVLDLCTGTGDLADIWIGHPQVGTVKALDSCAPMLESGYQKLVKKYNGAPPKLEMLEADAMKIPYDDNSFDAVTISFGLRNVADPDSCIREIFRVLKPGGMFVCLDLGHPPVSIIDWLYKKVFMRVIPFLGSGFARDKAAYQYLVDSLATWPSQRNLSKALYDFGFSRSYYRDIMLGAIALVVAEK